MHSVGMRKIVIGVFQKESILLAAGKMAIYTYTKDWRMNQRLNESGNKCVVNKNGRKKMPGN